MVETAKAASHPCVVNSMAPFCTLRNRKLALIRRTARGCISRLQIEVFLSRSGLQFDQTPLRLGQFSTKHRLVQPLSLHPRRNLQRCRRGTSTMKRSCSERQAQRHVHRRGFVNNSFIEGGPRYPLEKANSLYSRRSWQPPEGSAKKELH